MRNTAARTPRKSPLLPERVDTAMARIIEFYVDFISPFSYLAHHRLPDLAARYGFTIDYHVADLSELRRLAGNTGPRQTEQPLKLPYSRIDQKRWADRYRAAWEADDPGGRGRPVRARLRLPLTVGTPLLEPPRSKRLSAPKSDRRRPTLMGLLRGFASRLLG